MRICFTSLEENKHLQEIEEKIKTALKDTDYSIVVVPSRYEKDGEKIRKYRKEYYQKNRERLVQEERERKARKKQKALER